MLLEVPEEPMKIADVAPYAQLSLIDPSFDSLHNKRASLADTVERRDERLRAGHCVEFGRRIGFRDSFRERFGDAEHFEWKHHGHIVPVETLEEVFTFDEQVRLWQSMILMSRLCDHIKERHPLLWKISNAMWRYGCHTSHNDLVMFMRGLAALSLDKPGFELRLTWSSHFNECGRAVHVDDLFLDGPIGILVFYKNEHVMTIAIAPSFDGVLITQIQLRKKKGNRFLFHLGDHYVDVAIGIVERAFGTMFPVHLVDGATAVAAIKKAYGHGAAADALRAEKFNPEIEARIASVYDRELARFERALATPRPWLRYEDDSLVQEPPKLLSYFGRHYWRLVPRTKERAA